MGAVPAYSEAFKSRMVRRMTGPDAISATALGRETGVTQATLSRWLRDASTRTVVAMSKTRKVGDAGPSPRTRTAQEKLRLVAAAQALSGDELGAFLRREGVLEAELKQWTEAMEEALDATARPMSRAERKRIRELERELKRKDKALAETAALLVLSKKVEALWGAEGDGTDEENEK